MGCHGFLITSLRINFIQRLEYHVIASLEVCSVEPESYLYGALRVLRYEGSVADDLFAASLCGLTGRLVHQYTVNMVLIAHIDILVAYGINDCLRALVGNLMIAVFLVNGCRAYLGETDCLIFVVEVEVDEDFLAVGLHGLASHYGLAGKAEAVESEFNDRASVSCLGNEFLVCNDFLAIYDQRQACSLVIKDTVQCVQLAGDEVLKDDLVIDSDFLVSVGSMASCIAVKSGCAAIREVDGLLIVIDILVGEDRCSCFEFRMDHIHIFKHYYAPAREFVGVDHKVDVFNAVFVFGGKYPLVDIVAVSIDHSRLKLDRLFLAKRLEHDLTGQNIFVAGKYILIEDTVFDKYFTLGHHGPVIRVRVSCLRVAVRILDSLILVINVFVDDDFLAVVIRTLEDNCVLAGKIGSVDHECKLDGSVLLIGCKRNRRYR